MPFGAKEEKSRYPGRDCKKEVTISFSFPMTEEE